MLERVIIPAFGNHWVTEVTRADVARIHHDLRHISYDANCCLEIISKMFNLAEMWGCVRRDRTRVSTSRSIPGELVAYMSHFLLSKSHRAGA